MKFYLAKDFKLENMCNSKLKQLISGMAFLVLISVFTSCNRNGYGCPYELKAPTTAIMKCIVK